MAKYEDGKLTFDDSDNLSKDAFEQLQTDLTGTTYTSENDPYGLGLPIEEVLWSGTEWFDDGSASEEITVMGDQHKVKPRKSAKLREDIENEVGEMSDFDYGVLRGSMALEEDFADSNFRNSGAIVPSTDHLKILAAVQLGRAAFGGLKYLIDDVAISGTNVRNASLAGKVHPKTGVPFNRSGFPNFKNHLYKGGKNNVKITPTGNRLTDFKAANKVAGYTSTPKGFTWHHHQTFGKMQLVESSVHAKTGHTGGYTIWNSVK